MAGYLHRGLRAIIEKAPGDVVILSALRTPITRAHKGGLRDAYPEELLATVLGATLAAVPRLDPGRVDDVAVGTVLQELGGAKAARAAALHAGLPTRTALHTVNRQCSSGLAAVTGIAHALALGAIDVGIGAGTESMTRNYGTRAIPTVLWPPLRKSPSVDARDCLMPMGLTSENVAERYGVGRADQDAFAARSHQKAARAQREGRFASEIVSVTTQRREPDAAENDAGVEVTVERDDGVRQDASIEAMARLKPAFKEGGSSTAGNSSQISDGAAAVLLMRRSTADELGLSDAILGKWAGTQIAGCAPDEMGIGPALAIPKLLAYTGLRTEDVGVWEINEAFASQALYCIRKLGIDEELVNPNGGSIAIGHPLGATGARQLATLLPEMKRQGQEVGVVSMCIGTGMGKFQPTQAPGFTS